ncbi:MAG TPA: carboxypeptidase-like regulatory domain-containing protein [Candidatus Thermoplasmatota archaeon]|nr:carboxypeptidase-like regulatory domain-containing protein [Candidatus Thermoplasmatota archaeon]
MRTQGSAAMLAAALALAGCSGSPAAPAAASPTTTPTAEEPTVDASTGSISGLAVDDESRPVPGATVAVSETNQQVETDEAGRFTVNGLAPGEYRLFANALGYVSQARKVSVRPGEVTEVQFMLEAVPITAEPYIAAMPRVAFINADQGLVGGGLRFVAGVNLSTLDDLFCSSCQHTYTITPKPVQVLSEVYWTDSGNPVTNQAIELWYWLGKRDYVGLAKYELADLKNRGVKDWSASGLAHLKTTKVDKIYLDVIADETGLSFQHRVNIWTSFAYNAPLPDEYTALPPP